MKGSILNKINEPKDLKNLNQEELNILAEEVRDVLIKKVSKTGGHFGPNLGMVEATIALHYVFNSPIDKIVYDVSHQSYPHKILTGRKENFINPEKFGEITGYTSQHESEHDFFTVGHTSTSISLACGLAKARDVNGEKENIIAVIGDGSLSGGEAYEGLNNAAESGKNIIIVVNDNDMSIAENHGGLYKNLAELRETNGASENNFFKALGFEYYYVGEGNNVEALIETFNKVKDTEHPVVVHIHTIKGKGYEEAEKNKEAFHWVMPFDLENKEHLTLLERTIKSNGSELISGDIKRFVERNIELNKKDNITNCYIIENNNSFIGLAFLNYHPEEKRDEKILSEEIEIGLGILPEFRGKHLGSQFEKEFSEYLLNKYPQFNEVVARIDNNNIKSINAVKKAGLEHIDGEEYHFKRFKK